MSQLPALIRRDEPHPRDIGLPPVVRIQQMILEEAVAMDASDVHIEPSAGATRVRYRVNGRLRQSLEVPRWMHDNLISRIKILARLDISERRLPQDGHIHGSASEPDLRVSILPTRWGEKAVIRLLRRGRTLMTFSQLGMGGEIEERLQAVIRRPQGILLVAGPTGSGKTTSLYALINEIRQEPLSIVTIEDPIEYEVDGVTQVQVHDKAGLTFACALRAILRQDPDVILVGEIRDADTADTAFHAAMTGHLVLSTIHATDAISTFMRLADLGVARDLIPAALVGILSQRLVRLNCSLCAEPEFPRPVYLERLGIDVAARSGLRQGRGCHACGLTGASGRIGVFEFLEATGAVRSAANTGEEAEIRKAARASGWASLSEQAVRLALDGQVPLAEVYRTCYFGEM